MTHCRRVAVLTSVISFFLFSFKVQAQRPSEQYKSAIVAGRLEPRVRTFVTVCLGATSLPKPVALYSQGTWFVTPDLAVHIQEQGSNDDGTAQVWSIAARPRAVSFWVHDDEFDRSVLACLNDKGIVTRQVNEYMPGMSEPDLHWIYDHSLVLDSRGKYRSSGHYTDWQRHAIPQPKLTSEDSDFLAGERRYENWKDFDFAEQLQDSGAP